MLPSTPAFALNAALHGLNAVLLAWALLRLGAGPRGAVLGALLFAVHPAQIPLVAAAPGAPSGLTAWIVALLLHSAREPGRFSPRIEAGLLAAMAAGWITTPSILLLPMALLAVDRIARGRRDTRGMLAEKAPMIAAAVLGGLWLLGNSTTLSGLVAAADGAQRAGLALDALGDTLGLCLGLRTPTALSAPTVGPLPEALVRAAVPVAGLCALARWFPRVGPGLAWFAVALIGVVGGIGSDRFGVSAPSTSVALIGLGWAAGTGLAPPGRGRRLVAAALLLTCGGRSAGELRFWTDEPALLAHTVAAEPAHWVAHSRLGDLLADEGRWDLALEEQLVAACIEPRFVWAQTGLADALRATGHDEAARLVYENVLQTGWTDDEAGARFGFVLLRLGRDAEAARVLQEAAARRPADPNLQAGLALARARTGELDAARRHREAMLRIGPTSVDGRFCAAWLLATAPEPELRDPDAALQFVRADDPPRLLDAHAAAAAGVGRFADAYAIAQRAAARLEREGWPDRAAGIRERARSYLESRVWSEPRGSAPAPDREMDGDREGAHGG